MEEIPVIESIQFKSRKGRNHEYLDVMQFRLCLQPPYSWWDSKKE